MSRKILLGLAISIGAASLAFMLIFIEAYRTRLARERGNASEQVNRLLQVALENAMVKRDLPGLQDIVSRLGKQPGITNVMIVNPAREVRFSSMAVDLHRTLAPEDLVCAGCAPDAESGLSPATRLFTLADGRDVLRSVNPIRNRAECKECHGPADVHPVNGILIVDHDTAGLRHEALWAAAAMSGAGLVVVMLGMGMHWLVLRRHVLMPIAALDAASRALSAGDLDARVAIPAGRGDEVRDLSKTFNGMADTLRLTMLDLREQEAFLKGLIDTVPDGVRVIDENKRVVLVNASLARQTGVDQADLIGAPCYALHGRDSPCSPTLLTCPFAALTTDGEPIRYMHRHVRKDGSTVHVETTAARVTLQTRGVPRVLIIEAIRDLEQQIKYSHEQRLSEIGQLAAGVAHEIYNPLASVRIGLQAVVRRAGDTADIDPLLTHYLGMVDGEVEKCIGVAKRLLDLSQVPSTNIQLVSLASIVPDVASLLSFEAEQRGVAMQIDLGSVDLRVLATDAELRMVTLNLMQNAFHAMPTGGTLAISGWQDERDVMLRFTDSGVGIEPEALEHIFDAFFSRRADGVNGTGLGLTICKSIMMRYGGDISVDSKPKAGSTFTIKLPRADSGMGGT